ncbi:MAG: ABC transporter permease subunit [Clostridium sp.]|uniref:ABC transporter permease subunit n=1 Tax=Clostridium sp. TaxID=1506 RepID=UPI003D6C8883
MLRLVKAEIYILFKTRTFKVLCVIALFLGLLLLGQSSSTQNRLKAMSPEQQKQYVENDKIANEPNVSVEPSGSIGIHLGAKDIVHPRAMEIFYSSFGSGVVEILMAILIGAMVGSEYSSGTIKNIVAYGKKREYYYISKLIACSVGFIIILGIIVSIPTVGWSFMFGWGEPFTFMQIVQIVAVFASATVVGMGIISLLMLLATLVKSNGSTIGIGTVVMSILPIIITLFYGKYVWFDKMYEDTLSYNWALATSIRSTNGEILKAVVVGFITLVIATAAGITIFKKQDIK